MVPLKRGARGVVVSHPLSMREALGSIPSVSSFVFLEPPHTCHSDFILAQFVADLIADIFNLVSPTPSNPSMSSEVFLASSGTCTSAVILAQHDRRSRGAVVSHPLRMRGALGSIASVPNLVILTSPGTWCSGITQHAGDPGSNL